MLRVDNVGAYVRGADGTLIESVTINSVDRLAVDSTLKDGVGNALTSTDAGGGIRALDVNIASPLTIDVDLTHVDDSVRLGDGTDLVTTTTVGPDVGLDVNIINASLVVTATDLDIRDLDAAQDSVASWLNDGAGTAITSTLEGAKQALDVYVANDLVVNDAALADTALANAAATLAVADTSQAVVPSPLADRKYLYVANRDNKFIFVGTSGVTAANGFPIPPSGIAEFRAGAAIAMHFVGSTGSTPEIRTLELA